ncbi:UDP-N-acetylglucosamine diphosphorylase/glucosamine-1-phosphate N-acetyltransferase [Thalassovita gelatinovora]|uniref:UDP-N-acetylglucosamine diphosphorylase/glucosamine-1-phosphate N-acetyltransferase n=1 Tax=Thalassovita gelatinovora TaxID=53501 RepID=A0A0P1FA26_THAGE|nr:nucleotidyltransferase family protein [Thalassovita gelatinovora]QIZ81036.1 nucleotidyltransferase family protein [Thalassovita gelatinovora]CUH65021.1 UDP-N-acetylglucosamine diphosphorylase/glucosamine-1-phosphate N-acetyltransferase [Thalassovita gelatinovora]SEP87850.1 mannose-1-phosphate guanylyltransferase [Thalassovita gelatinovora]
MRDCPHPVMLFAAGFGTRMGTLTADRPKPLIEVADRPLIDHALDLVDDYGAKKVVANLHYKPDMLRTHLAGRDIGFSEESPDILETGGGLRAALPLLGPGPVMTLNTDAIWAGPNPLQILAEAWDPDLMDALLICIPRDRALGHSGTGDFLSDDQGRLRRGPGAIFGGAQIVKPDRLHSIEQDAFSLNLLWDQLLPEGRLFGIGYPGQWCDVGRPEGIALAERMMGYRDV